MSKTNPAVVWLDAEIIRLKRELAEHELARNIMLNMPTTKTEVALTAFPAPRTIKNIKWTDIPVEGVPAREESKFVSKFSMLPVGMGQREKLVLRTIGAGSLTSGEIIRKIGCRTKQDKQMIYVALSSLKRQRVLHQDETTRQYSDAQS